MSNSSVPPAQETNKNTKALGKLTKGIGGLVTPTVALVGGLTAVTTGIIKLMLAFDKNNQMLMRSGLTQEIVQSKFSKSFDTMTTKFGVNFLEANSIIAKAYSEGLEANSEAFAALLITVKRTGGNLQKVMGGLEKLNEIMPMNSETLGEVSEGLLDMSSRFGISVTKLIGAMTKLGDSLSVQTARGLAPELTKLVQSMIKGIGVPARDSISSLLAKLTSGEVGAGALQAKLGVNIDKLLKLNPEDATNQLREAVTKAITRSGVETNRFGMERLKSVFGDQATSLLRIFNSMKAFDKRADLGRNAARNRVTYSMNSIGAILEKIKAFMFDILSPLIQTIISSVQTGFQFIFGNSAENLDMFSNATKRLNAINNSAIAIKEGNNKNLKPIIDNTKKTAKAVEAQSKTNKKETSPKLRVKKDPLNILIKTIKDSISAQTEHLNGTAKDISKKNDSLRTNRGKEQ